MLKKLLFFSSFCCFLITSVASASDVSLKYDNETKGLVRKMKVYKDPSWVSKVITSESKEFYFLSPKSMFEFYFNPKKWPITNVENRNNIKEIIVTDYFTLKPIRAREAYYVYGSNKVSLAGDDLPAFKLYSHAQEFAEKNNGKRIFKFNEVKKALIDLLNGNI
ncbi:nitrous oxide reductase accessory protein NosL [Halarcobacter anaerophilus]|uniref:NosL domain-containing protein n=1 Tax=Halarcobacter anaerophilus TaxID=877500 RepID=A0A4Q0XY12_9BACT|nr:nitrous oxide reductase accessory protein NosL [Halarcobacter anaerophilus]QDF28182.1 NosL domain-containing protein [Halarcobacter anaerophilus]RXJ62527.1 hypothetical protein CRV06_10320 [Halarcobacter anaerophilus]